MGALKIWTGSQWTEAGGGLRDVPSAVVGAEMSLGISNQTITDAAGFATIAYDQVSWDTDGIADATTDHDFTVPAGMSGKWLLSGSVTLGGSIGSISQIDIIGYVNGAWTQNLVRYNPPSSGTIAYSFAKVLDLTAGDVVTIVCNTTGASALLLGDANGVATNASLIKLGSGTVGDVIGAKAYEESTQTIATSTNVDVTFDTLIFDSDGFTDLGGASDEFTVPAGLAGKYLAVGGVEFVANASGYRRILIGINGTATDTLMHEGTPDNTDVTRLAGSAILDLAVGDVVTLMARQTSGGNLNIGNAGAGRSHFALVLLATSGAPGPRTPGYTFDYTEKTTATSVTSTSSASPDTIVSSGAVSYDGTAEVDIEFWVAGATPSASAGATLIFQLWDGATNIGTFGYVYSQATNNAYTPVCLKRRVTPSAGTHTYHVKAYVSTGTATLSTGSGGSGNNMPGYIKITRA